MSLGASKSRLVSLTRELSVHWNQTKDSWKDAKAVEFEKKYLTDLFVSVDNAVAIIEQLDQLIRKIRTECE